MCGSLNQWDMLTTDQAKHYLFEVIREAELVGFQFRRFQAAAEEWLKADAVEPPTGKALFASSESEREMLASLEGVLSGFARISLFFFPERQAGDRGQARAAMLRELTGINDSHPLAKRDLRNHWMHLDERLDRVLAETGVVAVGYYLDKAHRIPESQRRGMLRLIDPGQERVYVLGEVFHLKELADAVEHADQQAALAIVGNDDEEDQTKGP
jgi:hypothetical protein